MSTPFGMQLTPQRRKTAEWLQKKRQCARCSREYKEIDNLGTHNCEYYHPFGVLFDSRGNYLCCHRPAGSLGCVKADHTDGSNSGLKVATHTDEMQTDVTADDVLFVASLLKIDLQLVKQPTWIFDRAQQVWRIPRLDIAGRATAMHRMYDVV